MKIEKFNLTKDNLLKIMELDKTFYHDDKLTEEWYFERFKEFYEGIGLYDGEKLVGYLVAAPISQKLFNEIKEGKYTNDIDFDPKEFIKQSDYYYIDSILILPEYRNNSYSLKMINSLNPNKTYIAITVSKEGYYLAKIYMKEIKELNKTAHIFVREPINL